ncbi:uncharacterized protein LOC115949179, partial [Geospiza fortis]|uniref:Uncharacterized protein LOC115949179 n=1 Tax=Geospiza fortis TaxID=48883 RepID=A0A8N5I4M0_GEOFO
PGEISLAQSDCSLGRGREGEIRGVGWGCLLPAGSEPWGLPHLGALGVWDLLTCLGLCPKTCILLTWTLQTVGSARLDLCPWICSPCGTCLPGPAHLSTPRTCSPCGICSPGPHRLWDLLTWILLTWTPQTVGSAHLDLCPWICSPCGTCLPGPAHLSTPRTCSPCGICSPGPHRLWDLLTWILLTWTPQTVGSAHLDLCPWICSPCGTCLPGPAHLSTPRTCSPCGICSPGPHRLWDLLTWILLTWTPQTVGSAHLDLCPWICSPCGTCLPGPAHLSTPRTCSPCGICSPGPHRLWDLLTWILLTWTPQTSECDRCLHTGGTGAPEVCQVLSPTVPVVPVLSPGVPVVPVLSAGVPALSTGVRRY